MQGLIEDQVEARYSTCGSLVAQHYQPVPSNDASNIQPPPVIVPERADERGYVATCCRAIVINPVLQASTGGHFGCDSRTNQCGIRNVLIDDAARKLHAVRQPLVRVRHEFPHFEPLPRRVRAVAECSVRHDMTLKCVVPLEGCLPAHMPVGLRPASGACGRVIPRATRDQRIRDISVPEDRHGPRDIVGLCGADIKKGAPMHDAHIAQRYLCVCQCRLARTARGTTGIVNQQPSDGIHPQIAAKVHAARLIPPVPA